MTAWAQADGPEYYRIDLVPTDNLDGLGRASGHAQVSYRPSPFGPSIAPDGSYALDLTVEMTELPPAPQGHAYTVWLSTPSLDKINRLGVLDEDHQLEGQVDWNKFIVIVTLETAARETAGQAAERWQGPIVFRGLSRSGLMHTMAGHGPFANEPCAQYGY